jgi:hypothetical protein
VPSLQTSLGADTDALARDVAAGQRVMAPIRNW